MMRTPSRCRLAALLLPLLCSTACTRTVQVPVVQPRAACPLPDLPPFPELTAAPCGDASDPEVCLPANQAAEIYGWAKAAMRVDEMARTCLNDGAAPLKLVPSDTAEAAIVEVASWLRFGRVAVTFKFEDCGEENAFYNSADHTLTVCRELMVLDPAIVPFAVAHEMAHAVIDQLHIPFTGSEEVAADELAAVALSVHDRTDMVLDAGDVFKDLGGDDHPWDDHTSNIRRATTIDCLALARARPGTLPVCDARMARATQSWLTLIKAGLGG